MIGWEERLRNDPFLCLMGHKILSQQWAYVQCYGQHITRPISQPNFTFMVFSSSELLYCLMTDAHDCEQLSLCCFAANGAILNVSLTLIQKF